MSGGRLEWLRLRLRLRLRRPGDRWWQFAASVTSVVAVLLASIALLMHQIATPWTITIALTAASHYLMWAAPVGTLFAVLGRRWATAAVAAAELVLVALIQIPPLVADGAGSGAGLVLLQANLRIGHADPDALVELVRDHHVDVLATEELTTSEQSRLIAAGLPSLLPYRFTAPLPDGGGGLGMWSRFPLADTANLPGYSAGVLTAQVNGRGGFTLVAVHVSAPYPRPVHFWRHDISDLRGVLRAMPTGRPVLVAGDFNATTDHPQFRALLAGGYADAAGQAGAGYLPTYPTDRWWGPFVGIDHVLTRDAVATSARTYTLRDSDHRSLLVRVVLRQR